MWLPRLYKSIQCGRECCRSLVFAENFFLKSPLLSYLEQIRGRKRALKKPLTKQERLERRLKREEKEAKRKQYTFMQRLQIRRMSKLMSPSEQFPGRYDAEAETNLLDIPSSGNVFICKEHRTQFYSITKALELHRRLQMPSMYNHPNGALKLRIELNMSTEKATKMISDSEEIVPVPFSFEHKEKRTILALASSKENQQIAVDAGAEIALGTDMIKKILKGEFIITDYDFCVAHTDMGTSILPLRGMLRSKFPTAMNGALGTELPQIIQRFMTGVKLTIKADPVHPSWGLSVPIIGKLSMADDEIETNIAKIIEALCKHRTPALGPFINRATLSVVPDKMCFALDVSKYVPVVTESDMEKLASRQKKKKKANKEEEKTLEEDDDSYLLTLM